VRAFVASALGLIAATLIGCGEQEMRMALNYACMEEGSNGCAKWTQDGTSGTKDEPDAFKVAVEYTCKEYSTYGYCKTWSQNGNAKKEGSSGCFPGSSIVFTRHGPMPIAKVAVGDELLGRDDKTGAITYSKIRAFLHRDVDADTEMTVLTTANGRIVVSPKHSIATDLGYVFASQLNVGDSFLSWNRTRVTLLAKGVERALGLYAPFTTTSNYFAGESEQSAILAHSFAHVWKPDIFASVLHRIFDIAEFFWPHLHDVNPNEAAYVHPVSQRLAPLVGIHI